MRRHDLSDEVQRFLRAHVHSVGQLEILALVGGAPERGWTIAEVESVLRSSGEFIGRHLAEYARLGLLIGGPGPEISYRYQPTDSVLAAAAAQTLEAYRTRPVAVIEKIFNPGSGAAQSFADAFRIRPRS